MKLRASLALAFTGMIACSAQADSLLQGGAYEVTYRLEVPHVEQWAIDNTVRICVRRSGDQRGMALPVLSVNNPLSKCPASNIRQMGENLTYDIRCAGHDGAKAKAIYKLKPAGFQGRIAMVMGGKNMTFVEVQSGRRIGSCELAGDPPN
jgi:hypothetical protein